jgi:hypothetical protein
MYWLFDNANIIYILLGIIALGFITAWWLNKRVKYLAYAGGVVLLVGLFWFLTRLVVTDQQQIQHNVEAMAAAVVARDADALFKHIAADFTYRGNNRKQMYDAVGRAIKLHRVRDAYISDFTPTEVSRSAGKARASFRVRVDDDGGNVVFFARCEADFVLEAGQWMLRGVEFFNAVANQDQPIGIPLP